MHDKTEQSLLDVGRAFLEGLRVEHANAVAYVERLASTIESIEQTLRTLSDAPTQQLPLAAPILHNKYESRVPTHIAIGSAPEAAIALASGGNGWARRLRGMSQHEAIVQIAEDSGGIVRTKDAANILLRAGLSRAEPRNLYRYVLNFFTTSGMFEKAGKGTYRLIGFQPQDEYGEVPRDDEEENASHSE